MATIIYCIFETKGCSSKFLGTPHTYGFKYWDSINDEFCELLIKKINDCAKCKDKFLKDGTDRYVFKCYEHDMIKNERKKLDNNEIIKKYTIGRLTSVQKQALGVLDPNEEEELLKDIDID